MSSLTLSVLMRRWEEARRRGGAASRSRPPSCAAIAPSMRPTWRRWLA